MILLSSDSCSRSRMRIRRCDSCAAEVQRARNALSHADQNGSYGTVQRPSVLRSAVQRMQQPRQVKAAIQSADEEWVEAFIAQGGLGCVLECLAVLGEREVDSVSDAVPRLEVVSCLTAVLNCRYGLECIIRRGGREGSLVGKIALGEEYMCVGVQNFIVSAAS